MSQRSLKLSVSLEYGQMRNGELLGSYHLMLKAVRIGNFVVSPNVRNSFHLHLTETRSVQIR